MNDETRVKCPECNGTGVDASERPAVFVIGAKVDTPCVMCFGHGYIIARADPSPSGITEEKR